MSQHDYMMSDHDDLRIFRASAQVVVADIKALLAGKDLPYKGFDMFEGEDHNIRGQVQIEG